MSYSMRYPVDFRSGGDSVKEAFGKHIEEFTVVYGALNELAGNDLTAAEKEQLKTGSINGSRIIGAIAGTIPGENITGSVSGSKITGAITGATIPAEKVTGLKDYVEEEISGADKSEAQKSADGYMKFDNSLMLQWGRFDLLVNEAVRAVSFPKAFAKECYGIQLTVGYSQSDSPEYEEKFPSVAVLLDYVSQSGFSAARSQNIEIPIRVFYTAIGE